MFNEQQFLTSFVTTLGFFAALAGLIGIGFVSYRLWRLSKPWRERLWKNPLIQFVRMLGTAISNVLRIAKKHLADAIRILAASIWQTAIKLLLALGQGFQRLPDASLAVAFSLLPFLVFAVTGLYLSAILGIMAAGAVVGVVCAIPVVFKKTISQAVLTLCLWSAAGAWITSLMVAVLIAMALD